VLPLKY